MCANNNNLIDEFFLIIPGHCLAESMWKGISTQKIRQEYENQKISLEELKSHWYTLAPENNIANLKAKKVSFSRRNFYPMGTEKAPKIFNSPLDKKLWKELKHEIFLNGAFS